MATIMNRQREAAATAAARMADADTPLVRNCWYVAATSAEIGRALLARRLLDRSVLLFRAQDGRPVALQNRCCHRSYPLEHGTLDGDTIVCGYHGFRYDCAGTCIEVPSQPSVPPNLRLRSYPVVERAGFAWIWPGAPALADPALVPVPDWLEGGGWRRVVGYLHLAGSYVYMHENLLDLSHLSFLHATTFGTPEYARTPADETIDDTTIQVWRHVQCKLPSIYASPLGWEGAQCLRSSGARYVAPSLHVNTGRLRNLDLPEGAPGSTAGVEVAQLITPETQRTTHYWYALCRTFALDDEAVDAFMLRAQTVAFGEDQVALERIQRMHDEDHDPDFFESHVAVDRAGVTMRRRLKQLADAEAASG